MEFNSSFLLETNESKGWMQIKSIIGLIMIALAVSGTLLQKVTRFGFLVSLLFLGIVIIVTIIVHFVSRKGIQLYEVSFFSHHE